MSAPSTAKTSWDVYDSLSQAGVVLGSSGGSSGGSRDVSSAYFEWLLPFTSSFDITVAGRYDKYSDYGSDFSPKIAARWQPLDNLTLRGSWVGLPCPGSGHPDPRPIRSRPSRCRIPRAACSTA
ncbi:TonB-dependent receptor [Pseudoxanthomonas sp. NC8]|nr:TonB-dependent receptor [Pseudoxanthomonas sp. NC8]